MFCVGFRSPEAAHWSGIAVPPALEEDHKANMSGPRPSLSGRQPVGALPVRFVGVETVPWDGAARQGGTARRIN